jgi:hypothetical protein
MHPSAGQSGHSLQGSSYRTQEQQSKVRACRSAASPHTAGHDAHVGGLTWRPALSVIHPAPSYPDRILGVCEGASGVVRLVQAQARLWQADLRRFSQPLMGRRPRKSTPGRRSAVARLPLALVAQATDRRCAPAPSRAAGPPALPLETPVSRAGPWSPLGSLGRRQNSSTRTHTRICCCQRRWCGSQRSSYTHPPLNGEDKCEELKRIFVQRRVGLISRQGQ